MAEEQNLPSYGKRVKINVGGTIFETYLSTLTGVNDSVLSAMVSERWRNGEELFVDRNPTLFAKVLDYLRDEENFVPPSDDDAREALRREAEFYNLHGLAKKCLPREFCIGDVVKWKESAIESYWKVFAKHLYDTFGSQILGCIACPAKCPKYCIIPNMDVLNFEYCMPLKHHMRFMKGTVTEAEEVKLSAYGDHRTVKINVGGTVFETYRSTLTREDSILSAFVEERCQIEEIFVDRNPSLFGKILDYLRDVKNFVPPSEYDARQALRKEAELYKMRDLARLCRDEILGTGDIVCWKESAIESYWKYFAIYVIIFSLRSLVGKLVKCLVCGEEVNSFPWTKYVTFDFDCWEHLKHHMRFMHGQVIEVLKPCLRVQWLTRYKNNWSHIPPSALTLANPDRYTYLE